MESRLSVGTHSSLGDRLSICEPDEDGVSPSVLFEVRVPLCEVLEITLLDHRRFRITTEQDDTFTFTSPNAVTPLLFLVFE